MNEEGPDQLLMLRAIITGQVTDTQYSENVQHYGWCGYHYTLEKVLTDYQDSANQSASGQQVFTQIRDILVRMDSEVESATDSLEGILPDIEKILAQLRQHLLDISPANIHQINKLKTLIQAIEDVPLLIREEAVRETVREQQRILAEQEQTHLSNVTMTIATYISQHLKKDETLSTRYDETQDEDIVILTILVADDIIRRKIRVVKTAFTGNIDNFHIFSRKDFTIQTLQRIFHEMRATINSLVTPE